MDKKPTFFWRCCGSGCKMLDPLMFITLYKLHWSSCFLLGYSKYSKAINLTIVNHKSSYTQKIPCTCFGLHMLPTKGLVTAWVVSSPVYWRWRADSLPLFLSGLTWTGSGDCWTCLGNPETPCVMVKYPRNMFAEFVCRVWVVRQNPLQGTPSGIN